MGTLQPASSFYGPIVWVCFATLGAAAIVLVLREIILDQYTRVESTPTGATNVSFRDGTNTDVVRSTGDIKRIHIEYEVTNIDELRASVQNKEELKQFIGGE